MKKLWVFLLLILFSCQPDELMVVEPYPQYEMIFEETESSITDGQDISFQIITNEQHQLIISSQDGSVITKESFQPELGINTRKIYTNSLPKKRLKLTLENEVNILKSTFVIVN